MEIVGALLPLLVLALIVVLIVARAARDGRFRLRFRAPAAPRRKPRKSGLRAVDPDRMDEELRKLLRR